MSEYTPILLTSSRTPSISLEILPHGLTFHRFLVQVDGQTHDVLVAPEAPKDHLLKKYINSCVGRYANRVPTGSRQVERNGVKGEINPVGNQNERVAVHGGHVGFDSLPWELLTPSTPPTLFSAAELSHLPAMDQGYPGELTVEVLVALIEPESQQSKSGQSGADVAENEYDVGSLVYVYRAKVDKGVTPINLTQHWGFNLEASLQDGPDPLSVKNHALTLKCDRFVAKGPEGLHSGKYNAVSSSPGYDHNGKKIGKDYPQNGFDDFFVFENPPKTYPKNIPISSLTPESDIIKDILVPSDGVRTKKTPPLVELSSDKSGLRLAFETNQNGTLFYSNGKADPTLTARKKIHGGSGVKGDGYTPGSAAFLEFHEIFGDFLDPSHKDKDDSLLTSDELYHNYARCDVKYKKPTKA